MRVSESRPGVRSRSDLAVFIPSMQGGGAQRGTLKLAAGLTDRGVAIDLVLVKSDGPYMKDIPRGVRVIDLGASRTLAAVPRLARYLTRERPPVLLSVLDYANIVATWARSVSGTRPRTVLNEQNTLSKAASSGGLHRSGRVVPSLARQAYPRADAITAVSQGVADDLITTIGLPAEKVHVIHNPVVTPDLLARTRERVDDPWLVDVDPPVLLAVGRLSPQKDYPTLLRAFALLRRRRPVRLLILGEGPLRADLETEAASLGIRDDVRLPGFVENPFAYMARCAVYVMSSLYEGLPTVLIEALAAGARIVSTDCPSGPEEILAGGRFGRLVPIQDPGALAAAIERALDDRSPPPGPESWHPYELGTVVDRYQQLLFGNPS